MMIYLIPLKKLEVRVGGFFASYLFCTTPCLLQPTVAKLEIITQQLELPFSSTQEFSGPGEIAYKLSMLGEGLSNIGISCNIPPVSLQTACLYAVSLLPLKLQDSQTVISLL